jgi:hypothetical protein
MEPDRLWRATISPPAVRAERLSVFCLCPPCPPKHPCPSSSPMLAIAPAMAVLFGLVRGVLTRLSGTGKKRPTFEIVQAGARFQTVLRQAQGERLQPAAHLTTRRTNHRRDQEYCAMPSPLAAMKVIFSCTDTKVEPWLQGLCAALPGAEISVWQPGASLADHAVVWAPLQQLMDEPHPTPHPTPRRARCAKKALPRSRAISSPSSGAGHCRYRGYHTWLLTGLLARRFD